MSNKKKIIYASGGFLALVVVVVVVLAANLNRIINSRKDTILSQVEEKIGRDVSVGEVGVALWPQLGARVRDVVIADDPDFSTDAFVRAADMRVNVKLLPLLRKRVEINRFVLNEPVVSVIKGGANRFNFTSLVERASGAGGQPAPAGVSPGASAVPFVLAFADIENGTVRYVDPAAGIDRTVRAIDFSARDVSLDSKITVTLAAAVFGEEQDVRVEASVGPLGHVASPTDLSDAPLGATVNLGPVTLAQLAAAAPARNGAAKPPVQDGDVQAEATVSGTVGAATIDPLTVRVAMFGSSEPNVTVNASAGPFDLLADSTLVFASARVKGAIDAGPVPLSGVKLAPSAPGKPAPEIGGEASARVSFEGEATALSFDAHVDATAASYKVEGQVDKAPGIPATLDARGTVHPAGTAGEGVDITSMNLVVHALRASGKGRVVPFKGRESMEFTLDAATAIAPWKDLMPALAPFDPAGDAKATVRITGAPRPGAAPDIRGTATFSGVRATLPQVPNPLTAGEGTAAFTAKTATIDNASFKIGGSAFRLRADITSFAPMTATYSVTSAEVSRTDVQAPAPGAPKPPRPEVFRDVVVRGTAVERAPKQVENTMEITSKQGVASNIDYSDAKASVRATPESVFIDSFSARAMAGTVVGSGTMQPREAKFDVTTRVDNVNLVEYFRYKAPALVDVLSGRISGDVNLSGQGKTWEEVQKTLAGKGGAVVIEGALLNVNVAQQLISSIQSLPMVPADLTQKMRARNPKLFDSNATAFQNLKGSLSIAGGKVQVPDLKLATSDFSLTGAGWFSLSKELNMKTTLTLSDKLTSDLIAEVPAAKYLVAPGGKMEVPLTLSGGVVKPIVGVDTAALASRLQSGLLQQGQQGLNDQIKGFLDGLGKKKDDKKQ